ncbi:unnamed protein product [Blepharisma stoltei]|uniref:Uncharacterized protein n=1 Tax=Blepharisma stoltei TaxID=1481888 RepID=A0AAU9K541_9CILI|nr:unnamed protein product [Blepharisma stoltei]
MSLHASKSFEDFTAHSSAKRVPAFSSKILKKVSNYHSVNSLQLNSEKLRSDNSSFILSLANKSSIVKSNYSMNTSGIYLSPIKESTSPPIQFKSSVIKNKYNLIQVLQELEKSSDKPDIKKAKAASKALEICANESGAYQKEMQMITSEITRSLYADKKELDEDVLEKIYDKHTDALLDSEIPYFHISNTYKELWEESKNDINRLQKSLMHLERDFKVAIKARDKEIDRLKWEIQEAINAPVKAMEWKMVQLEEQNIRFKDDANDTQEKLNQAYMKINNYKAESSADKNLIGDLQVKTIQNEKQIIHLKESLNDLVNKHDAALNENKNLKTELESAVKMLEIIKDEKSELELQVKLLEIKISNLIADSGSGMENLTPRPNFGGTEEFHTLKGSSTKEKVGELIKLLKSFKLDRKPTRVFQRRETLNPKRKNTLGISIRKAERMFSVIEKTDDDL